jgi:hypothetical protein
MPNLGHVSDLVAVKFHYVDVVCLHALACRWARIALTGMTLCKRPNPYLFRKLRRTALQPLIVIFVSSNLKLRNGGLFFNVRNRIDGK